MKRPPFACIFLVMACTGSPGTTAGASSSPVPSVSATAPPPPQSTVGTCDARPPPPSDLSLVPDDAPEFMLYDLGTNPGAEPYDISLGADGNIYWSQNPGVLYTAPKTGGRTPAEIGGWRNLLGRDIASDATHVYWLDATKLHRRPKSGGPVEDLVLPLSAEGGTLALGERYAYVALWGCPAITRIDKTTLAMETMYIDGVAFNAGGPTSLAVDGDQIVCAAWKNIFVVSKWGAPPAHVVSDGDRIWSMVLTSDTIYWFDRPSQGLDGARIGWIPRGGVANMFQLVSSGVGDHAAFDPVAKKLWFQSGLWIASFSPETRHLSLVVRDRSSGAGVVIDDKYVYWAYHMVHGEIKRMPLSCKPIVPNAPSP